MAKQLKLAQDELTAAKQARDRYMNENAALLRQNKALQRKLDRLEKKAA
jgi:regulator of replication initiation timing